MRWLIGVLVDLAVGGFIALVVLLVDPTNIRLALAEGVIGCIATAALLAAYVRLRPHIVVLRRVTYADLLARASANDQETARLGAMRRALDEARKAENAPDVRVRVSRRVSPTGNTAGEPFRRWLHLVAENMSPTIASHAQLRIRIQRETTGDERHAPIEREWFWSGIREEIDLRQGAPIEIPIAIADIAHPNPPLLRSHEHLQPVGRWWITPEGHRNLTRHDVLVPARYWVDVTVRWADAGAVKTMAPEHFMLVIPERREQEAELIHTVAFDRY